MTSEQLACLEDLRPMVINVARRNRLCPDDLYGEACLVFLKAVRTHDPSKGGLRERVFFLVSRRLSKGGNWRSEKHHSRMVSLQFEPVDEGPDWNKILIDLSPDARCVLSLALSPPDGDEGTGRGWYKKRKAKLIRYLEQRRWSRRRIDRAFEEVREALP